MKVSLSHLECPGSLEQGFLKEDQLHLTALGHMISLLLAESHPGHSLEVLAFHFGVPSPGEPPSVFSLREAWTTLAQMNLDVTCGFSSFTWNSPEVGVLLLGRAFSSGTERSAGRGWEGAVAERVWS